ncbi:MAG: nicotinate (nicotinamide) nucleotide adenylyltransferase [Candidatus Hydrogenedentes bacterium]|nr:nicotinate (nicotinamide) nucleotide adenylyltransferase [Candidatus Hydrogenedentota bacterium]
MRIGVFGGTFDPIHKTHLDVARAAIEQASLDRVLFVVAGNPPHKHNATFASAEDRFALVQAAVVSEPRMEASRIEIDRPGPSFTADTLEALKALCPGSTLSLIIGMDALVDLPRWRAPQRILDLARILVVPRPGKWRIPDEVNGHYDVLSFASSDVSSTEIRRRIAAGESVDALLPPAVLRYIEDRGIYNACVPGAQGDCSDAS